MDNFILAYDPTNKNISLSLEVTKTNVIIREHNLLFLQNIDSSRSIKWFDSSEELIIVVGSAFFSESLEKEQTLVANENDLKNILQIFRLGKKLEDMLSGFYNVIYINKKTQNCKVHNSHFGMRPIFYYTQESFIILSNNPESINTIIKDKTGVNYSILSQIAVFNYSISYGSVFNSVNELPGGSILMFHQGKWKFERYFSSIELMKKSVYNKDDSLDVIDTYLEKTIDKYLSNIESFSTSLTGGWDGRVILSYLLEKVSNIETYSHGTANDKDISIPMKIAKEMDFTHNSYILDNQYYTSKFKQFAIETLKKSSATRSISKAHYLYSVGSELKNNEYVFTGICGSNLLKTGGFVPGNVTNKNVLNFVSNRNFDEFFSEILPDLKQLVWFNDGIKNQIRHDLQIIHNYYHEIDDEQIRFFVFLLNEIERKYFGSEIMSYSHLGENLSPFIDIQFVRALSETYFFGANLVPSKLNPLKSWESSILYANIIKRHNMEIGLFKTDRDVSLDNLLKKRNWARIFIKQIKRKYIKGNKVFYDHSSGIMNILNDLKGNYLLSKLNHETFNTFTINQISIIYWLSLNNKSDDRI